MSNSSWNFADVEVVVTNPHSVALSTLTDKTEDEIVEVRNKYVRWRNGDQNIFPLFLISHFKKIAETHPTFALPSSPSSPNAFNYGDIRKIVLSTDLQQTARETGRTSSSIATMRSNYRKFQTQNNFDGLDLAEHVKNIFLKLREEGAEITELRGRAPKQPGNESYQEESSDRRDPFAEYEILLQNFKRESAKLIEEMAASLVEERMKEIGELFSQAGKIDLSKRLKKLKKGLL